MKVNVNPEYLPVFHHIAKNAGTYTLSWMMMFCRKYNISCGSTKIKGWGAWRIRRALIKLPDGKQLTSCYYTPTDINRHNSNFSMHSLQDQSSDDVDLETFIKCIHSQDISPFSISIDPMDPGWKSAREAIEKIRDASNRKYLLQFTVLRDPYKRAQSLFSYLTSESSFHEPTHQCFKSKTFEDYIQSTEVEDSWFLRSLLDMEEKSIIEPHHLALAHDVYLKDFRIEDISNVDNLINNVFHGVYGIMQSDVESKVVKSNIDKNKTPNKKKVDFKKLPKEVQQIFMDRTYWDRKLWERYCKQQ